MKNVIRKASLATLVACAFIGTAAHAGGEVLVINETDDAIHPYFRYNCFGFTPDPSTVSNGWVNFGGIGGRGRFGWDFADPGLTNPSCPKPKLEFTYVKFGDPPPEKHPRVVGHMKFDPLTNFHLQIGERIKAINLLHGDDEDEDDD